MWILLRLWQPLISSESQSHPSYATPATVDPPDCQSNSQPIRARSRSEEPLRRPTCKIVPFLAEEESGQSGLFTGQLSWDVLSRLWLIWPEINHQLGNWKLTQCTDFTPQWGNIEVFKLQLCYALLTPPGNMQVIWNEVVGGVGRGGCGGVKPGFSVSSEPPEADMSCTTWWQPKKSPQSQQPTFDRLDLRDNDLILKPKTFLLTHHQHSGTNFPLCRTENTRTGRKHFCPVVMFNFNPLLTCRARRNMRPVCIINNYYLLSCHSVIMTVSTN